MPAQSNSENGGGVAEQADGEESFAAESIGGKSGGVAGEVVGRAVEGDDQRRRADAGKFEVGRDAEIERDQHRSVGVGEAVKNGAEGESQMTSGGTGATHPRLRTSRNACPYILIL